jgi:hypothetical protein
MGRIIVIYIEFYLFIYLFLLLVKFYNIKYLFKKSCISLKNEPNLIDFSPTCLSTNIKICICVFANTDIHK